MVALLANLEQRIMTLNVGGLRYVTTAATLAAVENSFLWKLVFLAPPHNSPRSGQSGEFFIDRTNRVSAPETCQGSPRATQYSGQNV